MRDIVVHGAAGALTVQHAEQKKQEIQRSHRHGFGLNTRFSTIARKQRIRGRGSILATARAQAGLPDEHKSQRSIRLPIVLTLRVGLPRARCIPDKAETTFRGVIDH